jgi:anti-sigma factor (TIGR02949 family)
LITAEIDGELAESSKAPLTEHLAVCSNCRTDYDLELSTKTFLNRRLKHVETPAHLRQQIMSELALHSGDPVRTAGWLSAFVSRRSTRGFIALGSALALILIFLVITPSKPGHSHTQPRDANIIHQTFNNFDGVLSGSLSPQISSEDPAVLDTYFASRVNFKVNCPKHKSYKLLGGVCSHFNDEPVANVVYRKGQDVVYLYETNFHCVCRGTHLNLPQAAMDQLHATGWYIENPKPECTLAVWLIDSTVCCAIADMSQDKLLAFLKEGE